MTSLWSFFSHLEDRWNQSGTSREIMMTAVAIVVGAFLLFAPNFNLPATYNFDEVYYVPAAKNLLAHDEPQNYEHPPLGKLIIAAGVHIFGDQPVGWRAMSAIFGVMTLLGIFLLGHLVFQSRLSAIFVTLISLFNNFIFVQSRIAMLDIFMVAFMVWAVYFFTLSIKQKNCKWSQLFLYLAGICLGLANSCKWFVLVFWASLWIFILLNWKRNFGWSKTNLILALGVTPVVAYMVTFLPYLLISRASGLPFTLVDLFSHFQWEIWSGQRRVTQSHPYQSPWYHWPLMIRPIWYFYEEIPGGTIKGIALIGNPVVVWGGLVSLFWLIKDSFRKSFNTAKVIVGLYLISLFSWWLIPRKITFFYYYFPSLIILGFALTYIFREGPNRFFSNKSGLSFLLQMVFLVFTIIMFIYFYPILSASSISRPQLEHRFWFQTWI